MRPWTPLLLIAALAPAPGCQGVSKLDLTTLSRGTWQRPEDVVAALAIEPGDTVADLGAGEGYFLPYLSDAVGSDGTVYAVDVDAEIVRELAERFPPDSTNVKATLGELDDPKLPAESLDLVLIVNTYHHIEDRPAYFRRLQAGLGAGGRVAVIEPNDGSRRRPAARPRRGTYQLGGRRRERDAGGGLPGGVPSRLPAGADLPDLRPGAGSARGPCRLRSSARRRPTGPPVSFPASAPSPRAACWSRTRSEAGSSPPPGFLARDLGDPVWILALWAIGGALALAGALSYAELGAAYPKVGGEYVYLREAFGPRAAFLSGWTSFTMGFGAPIAASSIAFAEYLRVLMPEALGGIPLPIPAVALVWGLTAIHLLGVEGGGRFQRLVTVLKVGGVLLLLAIGVGAGGGDPSHWTLASPDADPRVGTAAVGLIFVLYSFSGWNAAAYIAGEIRDPTRSLPRALLWGTGFVALLYLGLNLFYLYALPVEALASEPVLPVAEKAASALLGPGASTAVSALLCVSIAGATSSMVWAGPRVTWAMAEDGALPRRLGQLSASGAPRAATLLQAFWITGLLATGTFEQLVVYGGFAIALFSVAAVASVLVLRGTQPDRPLPFRVPGFPWVPLCFIAATLWIAGHTLIERPGEALLSLATVGVGLVLFAWTRRQSSIRSSGPQ